MTPKPTHVGVSTSVALTMAPPRHGWLAIELDLGTFQLSVGASDVLNDPVTELIDCAERLAHRAHSSSRICFWAEPNGYAVDVAATHLEVVDVRVLSHERFTPPMHKSGMQLEHRCAASRPALYRALRLALTRWLATSSSQLDEHWNKHASQGYRTRIGNLPKA